jgi:hypothetical protein
MASGLRVYTAGAGISADPESRENVFRASTTPVFDRHPGILAPSMALALRAAFGVRVCNPANTVTKRYLGPVAFESRRVARKSLGPGFRQDDGNRIDQRV